MIQSPEEFGRRGLCSTFSVPSLGVASPLYFPLCFPQVSLLDRSGMLLGGGGPFRLDSKLGMD